MMAVNDGDEAVVVTPAAREPRGSCGLIGVVRLQTPPSNNWRALMENHQHDHIL